MQAFLLHCLHDLTLHVQQIQKQFVFPTVHRQLYHCEHLRQMQFLQILSVQFCCINAISVGNNNFIISAVTPPATASSEGYEGKPILELIHLFLKRNQLYMAQACCIIFVMPSRNQGIVLCCANVSICSCSKWRIRKRKLEDN